MRLRACRACAMRAMRVQAVPCVVCVVVLYGTCWTRGWMFGRVSSAALCVSSACLAFRTRWKTADPASEQQVWARAQARACGRRCRLSREPRVLAARACRLEKSATRRHSPGFGATRVERRQTATMKRVLAWLRAKESNSLRSASG
eukprot:scaffold7481_cov57-Phaeocystis_antarctica.AAC.2